LTHTRYGRSNLPYWTTHTHTSRSDGSPDLVGALKTVTRAKILHYRQVYLNRDFLNKFRIDPELTREESGQFRFQFPSRRLFS